MGISLSALGKFEEAVATYRKAISIKPDYADAYYNLGITLQEQGRFEEAEFNYKKMIFFIFS